MKKELKVIWIVLSILFFLTQSSKLLTSTPSQDYEEVELSFSEPEFLNSGVYDFVRIPGASSVWDVGKPMLPSKGVQVLVEDREIDRVEVVSSESEILEGSFFIQPVQHPVANFTMPEVEPDQTVYDSDNLYPANIVENAGISRMRDYPILNLLVHPLQYKPKSRELTFYQNITLRIYYKQTYATKSVSQIAKEKRHESELFDNVVKDMVVNPTKVEEVKAERDSEYSISEYSVQSSPTYCSGLPSNWADDLKYLIITGPGSDTSSTALFDELGILAEWKKKKGVPTKIANYTEIINSEGFNCVGQDTAEQVRNFIKDVYDMWGIEYVLMAGGTSVVTERTGYGEVNTNPITTSNISTDLYYADLDVDSNWSSDGDDTWGETTDTVDLTPDVFIGRSPFTVSQSLQNWQASRLTNMTLHYEKNPPTDYLTTVLFLAEILDTSGHDAASSTNYSNATFVPSYWTATMLYDYLDNNEKGTVQNNINAGFHIINHDGHGSVDSLALTRADTYDPNNYLLANDFSHFTNGYNLSIFYTAACTIVHDFNSSSRFI